MLDWYRSAEGHWFARELHEDFEGLPEEQIPSRMQFAIDQGAAVASYLTAHGGRLVFGSDTPSAPTFGNPPGYNGFLELQTLAGIGIPPGRLLRAATIDSARALGLDDALGSVEPGKIANLLLLKENPLESVDAYDTIDSVIVHGVPVPRSELAAKRMGQ